MLQLRLRRLSIGAEPVALLFAIFVGILTLHVVDAFLAPHIAVDKPDTSSVEKLERALQMSAALPLQSGRATLKLVGELFVGIGNSRCNIFGGVDECVSIPDDTLFISHCNIKNRTVDCALEPGALQGIKNDPKALLKFNENECLQCSMAIQQFWCGQVLPHCGAFSYVIDEILPVLSSIAGKKESAREGLKGFVPRMIQALSLVLPCKKMCDAISHTCACGQSLTFGVVMTELQASAYQVNMSLSTAKDIFERIWHKPICDLFSEETAPGFIGVCDIQEGTRCEWCKKKPKSYLFFEPIILHIYQSVSGMMQAGVANVLLSAGGDTELTLDGLWEQNATTRGSHTKVLLFLIFLLVLTFGAFVAAVKMHRNRQEPSQYIDLNSLGYTPPML